ncbi:MAG: RNA methyltransferase [Planctomycetia bacterium]|nr:RNA methyltransferase [Planctomycetia bacterium]
MARVEDVSFSDSRLDAYRNLRDRTLRGESLFIAEGDLVVERLLKSRFGVESLLVVDRAMKRVLPMVERYLSSEVPVYTIPYEEVSQLTGFAFHQGVLAVGRREEVWSWEDLLASRRGKRRVLIVLPDITKPDNLGNVFRCAAALGADGILLGEQACDPLGRRCLRVSMGGVFQLPWHRSRNLAEDLTRLQQQGYACYATILDTSAVPLREVVWQPRVALLLGNEYDGLNAEMVEKCDEKITIPMAEGVDSLNLGVSCGIFLYEVCETAFSR